MSANSQVTADFLASTLAPVNAWASVLANAFDATTRQRAIDRIEELGGSVTISESGGISLQMPPRIRDWSYSCIHHYQDVIPSLL